MADTIMLMGTSSHVGKSIITTALCRIFHQQGRRVVPFKAQNMALNSYVTEEGLEMGRAQVAQAEAAGLRPMVDMNPVLLKPTGNSCSQVVLAGKPIGNMSAREYHTGYSLKAFEEVKKSLGRLQKAYDTIVIEGAGSPAEVNLKANDIVNMRVAKYLGAPVLLIADIDRGGSLASLVGTLELLDEDERALVKGLIINKFRGDVSLLTPAVDFLEKKTGKPVLGIVPHIEDIGIDDEDSVSLEDKDGVPKGDRDLDIVVIELPKLSNFTDFDALTNEPDVSVRYVHDAEALGHPDLILLPGSKNTTEDLLHLRTTGVEAEIRRLHDEGVPLVGICGGYQMLGKAVHDLHHVESEHTDTDAFGYLPMETFFADEKRTTQVYADADLDFLGTKITSSRLKGYEIHMGKTVFEGGVRHPFKITERNGVAAEVADGVQSEDGTIWGTYIHGIFDDDGFRRDFLNVLRQVKGLEPLPIQQHFRQEKERAYDRLAEIVRQSLDMEKLAAIMGEQA